ncbi:MAG TPA: pilin [Patescibacteria group bacterium]
MYKETRIIIIALFALITVFWGKGAHAEDNCRCTQSTNNLTLMFRDVKTYSAANDSDCNSMCWQYVLSQKDTSGMYSFGSDLTYKKITPVSSGSSGIGNPTSSKASGVVPGTTTDNSGLVPCGRPGQRMCGLCDMISGINGIIQYIMKISIGLALLAITIGAVMYVVSAGDSGMTGDAKNTMKNAGIGFAIVFTAWLLINTTIWILGTQTNSNGEPTMGINIVSWGQFDCTANNR